MGLIALGFVGALLVAQPTGQGLSLMQESITELSIARLPMVVLNMARSQAEYWQATRGGGHGDWRRIVLAPALPVLQPPSPSPRPVWTSH